MAETNYLADPRGLFSFLDFEDTEAGENAGGGSGTQQVFQDQPATPDDPTLPALSFPTGGGVLTQWDVASQSWV